MSARVASRLCRVCLQPEAKVVARGLCRPCYRQHRADGTLEQFPKTVVTRSYDTLPKSLGVSYRQLDYWATHGYLKPAVARPGSGSARQWPPGELEVAALMSRLVAAGLPVKVAHQVARGNPALAPGIRVVIDPDDEEVAS